MDSNCLFRQMFSLDGIPSFNLPTIGASTLPFCPRAYMLDVWLTLNGENKENFFTDFYFGVGKITHEIIQKWIPKTKTAKVFGNWKCICCDYNLSIKEKVGIINCPICGRPMEYEELEFVIPNIPVNGYCDLIVIDDNRNIDELNEYISLNKHKKAKRIKAYVIELKTSQSFIVNDLNLERRPISKNYKLQSEFYIYALNEFFRYKGIPIEIIKTVLKFIPRDRPSQVSKDFEVKPENYNFYKMTKKLIGMFSSGIVSGNMNLMKKVLSLKPCKKYPDLYDDCDKIDMCKSIKKFSEFKDIIDFMINDDLKHKIIKKQFNVLKFNLSNHYLTKN